MLRNGAKRHLRSIYSFYLSHFFIGLAINVCSATIVYRYGLLTIVSVCWLKALTTAIVFYSVNDTKKKEFFYYQNLGISKKMLWAFTLGLDLFQFIVFLKIAYSIR